MSLNQRFKSKTMFNPILLVFYVLIMCTAGYIIIKSKAATPPPVPPTIYLTPSSATSPINTTFIVSVHENSGTVAVNSVLANLSYNPALVDFVSMESAASPFTVQAQATGGVGAITIARGLVGTLTGDQLVANITFKTKTTSGSADVAFTAGSEILSGTTNKDILLSLSATAGGIYTIDATPPVVTLVSPANGSVISNGTTSIISVTATDNSSVSSVDILVDGAVKTTLTSPPYTYNWSTVGLALGPHTIQAKAKDPYGNSATSGINSITISDLTAPTLSISSPAANSSISGTTTISATAADNTGGTGLAKVEFYIDGVLKSSASVSPYSFVWDTKVGVGDGLHTITAKAYDKAVPANVSTSSPVTVTVDNSDHFPPTTPSGLSSGPPTLSTVSLSWGASTDNIAVTAYQIKRNGVVITSVAPTVLSYDDTGLLPGTTYTYTVSAMDGAGNLSSPATISASTKVLIPGDIDRNSRVDLTDLSIFLAHWGTNDPLSDIDHIGGVDLTDLSILLSNFGLSN